ncbi:rolling circle replication-associated protein [Clostridium intestinale]|uniref:rolling circle replication-associated protein n=1 Tax=Clostridium intestinale TaxID=36845 RepID=UPI002DD65E00|nr:hypothetical protein [Clostridium intestinale]WRY49500.1 hypothetical protein P8F83_12265 [Clostridium intestinale]
MPYREKKFYLGSTRKYLEVEHFPISFKERSKRRKDKKKETIPKQKNLNDKNAKKYLIRIINHNFTDKDLIAHLTYIDKYLPKSEEEARKDIKNYLLRVRRWRKKNGIKEELKYIAIIEYRDQVEGKKAIRIHHHVIINDMDRDILEDLWKKGRANVDRLQADEYGYEALARYVTKDPQGKKRWVPSKNLKPPIPDINDFRFSKKKIVEMSKTPEDREMFERLYPGYFLTKCSVEVNKETSEIYIYLKMRKLEWGDGEWI